jgi:hypothetical protein
VSPALTLARTLFALILAVAISPTLALRPCHRRPRHRVIFAFVLVVLCLAIVVVSRIGYRLRRYPRSCHHPHPLYSLRSGPRPRPLRHHPRCRSLPCSAFCLPYGGAGFPLYADSGSPHRAGVAPGLMWALIAFFSHLPRGQLLLVNLSTSLLNMRNFVTLKASALARMLIKPVTWSRLSKLSDHREDCHQAPRSDRASAPYDTLLEQNLLCIVDPHRS